VIKVSLDSEDFVAVVEIEINADVDNLSLDSSASIMTSGVLGEQYVALEVGAEEAYLAAGDEIEDTYSALVLEELVGKLLFNFK